MMTKTYRILNEKVGARNKGNAPHFLSMILRMYTMSAAVPCDEGVFIFDISDGVGVVGLFTQVESTAGVFSLGTRAGLPYGFQDGVDGFMWYRRPTWGNINVGHKRYTAGILEVFMFRCLIRNTSAPRSWFNDTF